VIRDFVPGRTRSCSTTRTWTPIDDLRFIRFFYEDTPSTRSFSSARTGAIDKSMGAIILKGIAPGDLTEADFIFAEGLPPELSDEPPKPETWTARS
jgi:hypothetical protein